MTCTCGNAFGSGGVLNPSGVWFGSIEIYVVIAYIDAAEDSIFVQQR